MHFSYHEIKESLYVLEPMFGAVMLLAAFRCLTLISVTTDPLSYFISALVLAIVGFGCLVFGVWSFHFRDDPDLWH